MDRKDGVIAVLVFLLLSLLIFMCHQVLQISAEVAQLQASVEKLRASETDKVHTTQEFLHNKVRSTREVSDGDELSTAQLLTTAFSEIVETQLKDHLDCDNGNNGCTIEPGPKGEQGELGPPGPKGDRGDRGDIGPRGVTGQKGNHGYPGYKGEKGMMGIQGRAGPVGPVGPVGPAGPATTMSQSNCNWQYTDTCRHQCGNERLYRTVCPIGQYVAGFGIWTWGSSGRYNTHVYCCAVSV